VLEIITQFFDKLPATSQAAIIASLVTLCGAIATATIALMGIFVAHRGNEKRLVKQLNHNREQKRVDREMELRKAVYLEAAEAIDAGLIVIGGYANLAKTGDELFQKFSEKRGALSKVHLIGKESTVTDVLAFNVEFGEELKRLSLLRQPLTQIQDRINFLTDQINSSIKERDRMIDLMKQLNFEGNQEPHRWEFVKKTFEFEEKKINNAIKERESLHTQLKHDWAIFASECVAASNRVTQLVAPAVKAVRDELELPFNYETYKATIDESLNRQQESMATYLEQVQKQ
jgi:hypothetical protein